jgi:hypothetical protein
MKLAQRRLCPGDPAAAGGEFHTGWRRGETDQPFEPMHCRGYLDLVQAIQAGLQPQRVILLKNETAGCR